MKYQLAFKKGLKGMGFYATPDLDPWGNATVPGNKDGPVQTAAMWDAVKQHFSKNNTIIVNRTTLRYDGTMARVLNPERGYRHELDDLPLVALDDLLLVLDLGNLDHLLLNDFNRRPDGIRLRLVSVLEDFLCSLLAWYLLRRKHPLLVTML